MNWAVSCWLSELLTVHPKIKWVKIAILRMALFNLNRFYTYCFIGSRPMSEG